MSVPYEGLRPAEQQELDELRRRHGRGEQQQQQQQQQPWDRGQQQQQQQIQGDGQGDRGPMQIVSREPNIPE